MRKAASPMLLRAVDPKCLIGNQNSHQLFNRYRANQLQRRRHGRRGDLREGGGRIEEIYPGMGVRHKGFDFAVFWQYVQIFLSVARVRR